MLSVVKAMDWWGWRYTATVDHTAKSLFTGQLKVQTKRRRERKILALGHDLSTTYRTCLKHASSCGRSL